MDKDLRGGLLFTLVLILGFAWSIHWFVSCADSRDLKREAGCAASCDGPYRYDIRDRECFCD